MASTLLNFDALAFDGDTVPVTAGDLAAYFDNINGRSVLVFIDGADESAAVTRAVQMPQQYAAGALAAKLCIFTAATTGSVVWEVYVEAVTDADASDMDTGALFDSANSGTVAVPGTAGYLDVFSITLTNKDSVAAGDLVRFLVRRNSPSGSDDAAANAYLMWLAIEE